MTIRDLKPCCPKRVVSESAVLDVVGDEECYQRNAYSIRACRRRIHDCHSSDREGDNEDGQDQLDDVDFRLVLFVEGEAEAHDDRIV